MSRRVIKIFSVVQRVEADNEQLLSPDSSWLLWRRPERFPPENRGRQDWVSETRGRGTGDVLCCLSVCLCAGIQY